MTNHNRRPYELDNDWYFDTCLDRPVVRGRADSREVSRLTLVGQGQERLMDTAEAAAFLKLKPRTVGDLVRRGEIPHLRIGSQIIRFKREELESYMRKQAGRNV